MKVPPSASTLPGRAAKICLCVSTPREDGGEYILSEFRSPIPLDKRRRCMDSPPPTPVRSPAHPVYIVGSEEFELTCGAETTFTYH